MTASILTCCMATLEPRSGGHVLRQTSHSATERSTLQDAGQLAGAHRMRLRHKPGPYVLSGRTRKVKTGTGRTKGPYSGSCARPESARAYQKSSGAWAQRRPRPLSFPAGLGYPPPPAAAPSLACAVRDREIRLGLRALARTGQGPAGLGLRAPPRVSPPPVGRSRPPGTPRPPGSVGVRSRPQPRARCEWFTFTGSNAGSQRTKPKLTRKKKKKLLSMNSKLHPSKKRYLCAISAFMPAI
ncbi:uncharacterized protein LOC110321279 [Mus pahari]|uniref:uncharacterized protein LOC110321279 n=1 Tax=Mus pahari TaxID=10093 RepID=UPI000A309ACE|nr:uncharacterized protein LOC110321279 [Mus pahari]